jgi:hypothetical protein
MADEGTAVVAIAGAAGDAGPTLSGEAAAGTGLACEAGLNNGLGIGLNTSAIGLASGLLRDFVRGTALPTTCTTGRRILTFSAGLMGSRGAEVAESNLATVGSAMPGTPKRALGIVSDEPELTA